MTGFFGRKKIVTQVESVTRENVINVLSSALLVHTINQGQIQYLWDYYKGKQPILGRLKEVRPEITNRVVENRANEIVSFKTGYLMGEPVQYVGRGENPETLSSINLLNTYMLAEDKAAKDKQLADWDHICGTAYKMALPDENAGEDEAPFEIYVPDPRFCFVIYSNRLDEKPMMSVNFYKDEEGRVVYCCYTENKYYEILDCVEIVKEEDQVLGIPVVEYPANPARLGAFEIVLPLLDAINNVDSNRLDGIEQFIQAIMLLHNVDLSSEDFENLRKQGALKFTDIDPQMKAEVKYLVEELNQDQSQTLVNHYYETILTICGMPNRNGGSSTSDTGSAVIMRDGWSAAEARAKDSELMYKQSEKEFLKIVLKICRTVSDLNLRLSAVEIRFTRRNYENISEKATVLTTMLNNKKIAPRLAFEHCGMFVDPELAYLMSEKYAEEYREREIGELEQIAGV